MKPRNVFALTALALSLGALPTVVPAAFTYGTILTEEQEQRLDPEALRHYREALVHADHINYDAAIAAMARAAEADPDHIELQFMAQRWARRRAENSYGDTSLTYYEMAEEALRRLLSNSTIGPEERQRSLAEAERVREGKELLAQRDEQRYDSGFNLVLQIREARVERRDGPGADNIRARDEESEAARAAEAEGEDEGRVNPFELAPGEQLALPQVPRPGAAGGYPGYVDPFAASAGYAGGMDPFGGGAAAPGMDPFGGGDPFAPAPGGDPFGAPPAAPGADPFGAGDPFAPAPPAAPAAPTGGGFK